MLSAFVPLCLAVIKRIHDALPARVQAVTDAWPSEVLVTAVVVALLLNIYVFLWNVKAHEAAKTRRSRATAAEEAPVTFIIHTRELWSSCSAKGVRVPSHERVLSCMTSAFCIESVAIERPSQHTSYRKCTF